MTEKSAAQRIQGYAKDKRCPGLLYLAAPDSIRKERAVQFLLRGLLSKNEPPYRLNGAELTLPKVQSLRDEVRSGSLFAKTRFIIVSQADAIPAPSLKALPTALELLAPGVHLLFMAKSLRKTDPLVAFIKKQGGELLEMPILKGFELRRWATKELAQQGLQTVSEAALEQIITLAEESPDEIARLAERLALYVDGPTVTEADLAALFANRIDPNDFALAEALSQKRPHELALLLHELMAAGRAPIMLLALVAKTYVTVLQIRVLLSQGKSAAQIRSELDISPWSFQRQLPLAQRQPIKVTALSIGNLIRADCKTKGKALGPIDIFMELGSSLHP